MLSPILHHASGLWILGKIENHTARPLTQTEIAAVISREVVLREEVDQLTADKERIDWLETHSFTAYRTRDPEDGQPDGHFTVVNEDKRPRGGCVQKTLRAAIDEARA